MTNPMSPAGAAKPEEQRLRIMHGGVFRDVMARIGLGGRGRRALILALLSWAVPVLLLVATRKDSTVQFLQDWGAWAKFLIAPILLTLAERPISFALDECVAMLFRIPLIASQSMADARKAVAVASDRSNAALPEFVCLMVAVVASAMNVYRFTAGDAPGWATEGKGLPLAAFWCLMFGNTLFWFLLTRMVWKHLVWSRFLGDVAKCRLRLAVTHPDGRAGLGFLGFYPAGYALFTLATSSVVAAGVGHVMQRQTVTPGLFTAVCAGWLFVVAAYFALPLVAMTTQISRLKREAIVASLTKALDFERWNERKSLGRNVFQDENEAGAEAADFHDMKALYSASLKTSALLLNKKNVLPVLLPALLPLLVVGASFLPYAELWPIVKRLLFL